jgi:hypothetical protein
MNTDQEIVTVMAKRIKDKIENGKIYSKPIDNEDARIVAAYFLGREEEKKKLMRGSGIRSDK